MRDMHRLWLVAVLMIGACAREPPPRYRLVGLPSHLTRAEQDERMEECRFKATALRRVDYFYSCLQGYGFQLEREN